MSHAGLGRLASASEIFVRLQANARFRRAASAFPVMRVVARRRAGALFDLCAGFVYSQVLLACVELDVPARLLRGARDAESLAPDLGLTTERTERLLAGAASLRIVSRRGGSYRLGPMGAALIDNPGVTAMIAHHALLYEDLRDPVALLRGEVPKTSLGSYWPYAGDPNAVGEEAAARYSALMEASQAMIASEVLDAYPVRRHRRLLDVGGGSGAFVREAERRAPSLRMAVFDLPAVARLARPRLDARVAVVGGDFLRDPLPEGADLVTLIRVLHDHDDDVAFELLRSVRRALAPGGRLLLAEPMAGTPGALSAGDGYFGFYLLAMGSGRPRSPRVIRAMLRAAGFARVRLLRTRTPLLTQVMIAG